MHTPEKSYKDEEHLPIRWMPQEVPEQQIKKSWDAIFNAIIEENASRKWEFSNLSPHPLQSK